MALSRFSRAAASPTLTFVLNAAALQLPAPCTSLFSKTAATPVGAASKAWRMQKAANSSSAACPRPPKVADLIDMHSGGLFGSPEQQASPLKVLAPGLRHFGGVRAFYGRVSTIQCCESNVQVGRTSKLGLNRAAGSANLCHANQSDLPLAPPLRLLLPCQRFTPFPPPPRKPPPPPLSTTRPCPLPFLPRRRAGTRGG